MDFRFNFDAEPSDAVATDAAASAVSAPSAPASDSEALRAGKELHLTVKALPGSNLRPCLLQAFLPLHVYEQACQEL